MLVQSLLSFFQLGLQNGITFDLRRKIQQIIEVKKELMKLPCTDIKRRYFKSHLFRNSILQLNFTCLQLLDFNTKQSKSQLISSMARDDKKQSMTHKDLM